MPRPRKGEFVVFNPDPEQVSRQVFDGILALFQFVRDFPDHREAILISRDLTRLKETGARPRTTIVVSTELFSLRTEFSWALRNLEELLRLGYYLRVCCYCKPGWFVPKNSRRAVCWRTDCQKSAALERQRLSREHHQQRRERKAAEHEAQEIEVQLQTAEAIQRQQRRHAK